MKVRVILCQSSTPDWPHFTGSTDSGWHVATGQDRATGDPGHVSSPLWALFCFFFFFLKWGLGLEGLYFTFRKLSTPLLSAKEISISYQGTLPLTLASWFEDIQQKLMVPNSDTHQFRWQGSRHRGQSLRQSDCPTSHQCAVNTNLLPKMSSLWPHIQMVPLWWSLSRQRWEKGHKTTQTTSSC